MMKNKNILILYFLVFGAGNALTQTLSVGVIGGPNRTYFWGPDFTQIYPAVNYIAGLTGEYSFSEKYSILVMPRYEEKGNKFDVALTDERGNRIGQFYIKNKLSYLTLPLLCQVKLGSNVKFIGMGGVYISYLLSARRKLTTNNPLFPAEKIRDDFKKIDAGLSFGIGMEVPVSRQINLSAILFNDVGLTDISDFALSAGPVKNNSTAILVGLAYRIGQ